MRHGTRGVRIAVALLALLIAGPAWAAPGVDWSAVLRALGGALDSWRQSPFGARTPTPRPPTRTATAPRTFTPTRIGTSTRSPTITPKETLTRVPTRTRTPTRTATATRTATSTRPPTRTYTPRPTSTPVPTLSDDGQIALAAAEGMPPAQKLASAFVIFPYIATSATQDTRIELMNMSNQQIELQCFYVRQSDCIEVGFFVSLTAGQPLSWLANEGTNNPLTFTAVPPFTGTVGELKCAVASNRPELSAHNVLQGRVLIYDNVTGETVGYDAIGFQKLSPGPFTGVINLDGFSYESCPDRLHFIVLTRQGGATSDLITVPCAEDLLNQTQTEVTVQLAIINEFEQVFSSSYRQTCLGAPNGQSFSRFGTLSKATLGTDTAHLVVRGVSSPLVGLVIDRFIGQNGTLHTTANEPFLEGGRESTVIFP
jgi:hypothetical protein